MKRILLLGVLILQACGDGGKSSPASTAPNYNGTYSFTTSNIEYRCQDNIGTFEGVTDGTNLDIAVVINGTNITGSITNIQDDFIGIVEGTDFVMQMLNYETTNEDGVTTSIDYEIEGKFQGNLWSGYYRFVANIDSMNMVCAYEAIFNGQKK